MKWAEEVFLKELEEVRKGDINWTLEMLEHHVERYKTELNKNASKQLREAVKEGVRIQIEKLRKDDGNSWSIDRAVKKYSLKEEGAMFKDAYKTYCTRSLEEYVSELETDRANYNERYWFIEHKNCANLNLQKRFEKALEDYRERSGIKEFEDINEITKKHGVDDWGWRDKKRKTLQLEVRLPYNLCEGFGKKVCEEVAKRYGGKIAYEEPYTPEDMSEPLTDGYWYMEIPATKKNLEVRSKKAVRARDEMEKRIYKVEEKLVKTALEPI